MAIEFEELFMDLNFINKIKRSNSNYMKMLIFSSIFKIFRFYKKIKEFLIMVFLTIYYHI